MVVNRVGGRRQRSAVVALNAQDQRRARAFAVILNYCFRPLDLDVRRLYQASQ